ncbi:predicted protein [Arabidopsis lyrata subsp. lyrata]|uniref:Predicted protein n=1 Tax=Arabidopsis lyrata subsp. lyrata TaxID=81972 RepID=D7MSN9_ARALL|nr:predicted protein [Arabidopsis lyrata subsp. lyrata]
MSLAPRHESIHQNISLSGDDLRNHLVNLESHLVGVKQQKISIMNLKKPKSKETEEDDHLRVSDNNATISNRKVSSSEEKRLGDVGSVTDSSLLDPFTLGFSGDCFPGDLIAVMDNLGVYANNGVWHPSWLDFDFLPTLFTDDWTVSCYNPLLGATDSFTASTYQTSITDCLGSVF